MKKKFLFSLAVISMLSIQGLTQNRLCDCKVDLLFMNENIEKIPSYKKNKAAYEKALSIALEKAEKSTSFFECFELLNELVIPLNDWHIGIIGQAPDSLNSNTVKYPMYQGDLDRLTQVLQKKPFEEVEGIYHTKQGFSFGITYVETEKAYQGVVLRSPTSNWKTGEIIYKFIPLPGNYLKVIGGQYPGKRLISYYERINNGVILRAGYQKDTLSPIYTRSPYPDATYLLKELSPDIDYLKVGSFSSYNPTLGEAEDFYESLEGKLNKKHLILDLRDNGGGGDRNSDILLKLLKTYLGKNNLYVITNARTGSNAEQFTLKLRKYDAVTTFGDKTKGALAYEIKPDDYFTLPSTNFILILTSKELKKFLPYETKGVVPDHFLEYKENWITQIEAFIKENK